MTDPADALEATFHAALDSGDREGVRAALLAIGEVAPERVEGLLDVAYPRPAGGFRPRMAGRAVDFMGYNQDRLEAFIDERRGEPNG